MAKEQQTESKDNGTVKIIRHPCKAIGPGASFQDETYGKGYRVCNLTNKGDAQNKKYRCTVCNELVS